MGLKEVYRVIGELSRLELLSLKFQICEYTIVEKLMLIGLQWPLWLPEARVNKECISIISMSVYISLSLCQDISRTARVIPTNFL